MNFIRKKAERNRIVLGVLYLLLLVFYTIITVIIQNYLGLGISKKKFYFILFLTTAFIIIQFVLVSYTIVEMIVKLGINKANASDEEGKCKYLNSICCVSLAIDSLKSTYQIRLDDDTASKYSLYSSEKLIDKEEKFNNGEIWIVSYDLTSVAIDGKESATRENNIKKKIKYRLFYINDPRQKYSEVQENIKILDKKFKKKMKLYPYEKQISIFSFLFTLFGIIMFLDNDKKVIESYFILHSSNDKIKDPIYIRMSYCMERKYCKILSSIKDNARNPRQKI